MPIITISRGSYYHAKTVAEQTAEKLGYKCLSRDQIIDGLEQFHLPEIKLVRGLNDAFSVLDRFPHGKKRFKAAIKAAVLNNVLDGPAVYHGLVGHHFLGDIPHVLKVRIIADTESRVQADMKRENISEEQARYILKKDDEERRKWVMFLYGIDINDPENYNLVINVDELSDQEAVDIIATTAELPRFQESDESRAKLADSALQAQICSRLFDFPHATVSASSGSAVIGLKVPEGQQALIEERVEEMIGGIESLKDYTIRFEPYY